MHGLPSWWTSKPTRHFAKWLTIHFSEDIPSLQFIEWDDPCVERVVMGNDCWVGYVKICSSDLSFYSVRTYRKDKFPVYIRARRKTYCDLLYAPWTTDTAVPVHHNSRYVASYYWWLDDSQKKERNALQALSERKECLEQQKNQTIRETRTNGRSKKFFQALAMMQSVREGATT